MTRAGLTLMTKIEVVVTGDDVAAVESVLTAAGASGYTVLSGVSGLGHGGFHQGSLHFNDRDTMRMIVAVVAEDGADAVVTALRSLFADRPGVFFVTDTYVSRAEYFS